MTVEVRFSDEERRTLLVMTLNTLAHTEPRHRSMHEHMMTIAHKLQGADTVLVAHRVGYWEAPSPAATTTGPDDDV